MATMNPPRSIPTFDTDGFMREAETWDEGLARHIAAVDGLGDLNEHQIAVLHHLRDSYRRRDAVPALAHVCHMGGFGPDCMSRLFHDAREAWRIAGLPNPGEEAKAYL